MDPALNKLVSITTSWPCKHEGSYWRWQLKEPMKTNSMLLLKNLIWIRMLMKITVI
jgi:hypothetical protein